MSMVQILVALAVIAGLGLWAYIRHANQRHDKLEAARRAFSFRSYDIGFTAAQAECPHAFVTYTQSGVPGVITVPRRLCQVCRSDLGAAKLRGGRWT